MTNDITSRLDELLILVGAIGVAAEGTIAALAVLVRALRAAANWLGTIALVTRTLTDDHLVGRIVSGLDAAADGLDWARRIIPRLRLGARRGEAAGPAVDPRGSALLGVLLIGGATLLGGCGQQRAVRTAIDIGGHALVTADETGADEYRRVEGRCDASATSLSGWRECMAPGFRLEEALRHVRADLYAAEAAADATGADGFAAIAPCVARSVDALAEALEALRVELPDELDEVRAIARGFGGACAAQGDDR